jgi:hypothetical protein
LGYADPKRRTALAKKAISISPDCADAYVLLAEATGLPGAFVWLAQRIDDKPALLN